MAFAGAAAAQDTDARLRAIEERLEQLDRRLDALESSKKPQGAAALSPAPAAPASCPTLDGLRIGMTEAEARRSVGEPAKVDVSPVWMVWRFPGCGNVHFDVDSRRVVGRSDP